MSKLDPILLEVLACPCEHHSPVTVQGEPATALECTRCRTTFPVRDGIPVRTRVGHSFIKARMAETGAVFGGEHSGHFYFRDFWRADSGMLAALHTLAALGETPEGTTLSSLLAQYQRYTASGEINTVVADQQAVLDELKATYSAQDGVTLDELDGLTVTGADESGRRWWFNVRPSNTEPLLRLNAEAADAATMGGLRDEVLALVRS